MARSMVRYSWDEIVGCTTGSGYRFARRRTVKVEVFERRKAKVTARIVIQRIPRVLAGMLG